MNKIKDLFLDEKIDISNKTYVVFTLATILAVIGVLFVNTLSKTDFAVTLIAWAMFFVQTVNLLYSVYKRRFYVQSVLSCIVINFMIFPFAFITGRLFFGSVVMWMVVGYTYTSLVLSKKTRLVVLIIQSIINIASFIVSFGLDWNKALIDYSDGDRLLNDWFAVIAGGILIFGMASFSSWLGSVEQKTIIKQKEDIASLYQNQNRFFSSMSHEIRTPINTVIGLNEVNLSLNLPEDVFDYSTEIKHAGRKLLTLINDILDLSKLQSGKMEIVEANYKLSDMISFITDDIWKESYDRGIKLSIIVDPNIPEELSGDEIRIRQIIRNILSNSVNAMESGNVELRVRFEKLSENEINLIFEVEDSGEGIRREELPYVFDTFRYIEEKNTGGEGTGLELPIAKSLSDVMGGSLSVDSIYSKGSKFRFSVAQKIVSQNAAENTSESSESRRTYKHFSAESARVLVVDDDGMNLSVFKKMFSDVFLNIDTATSGEEAITLCSDNDYDLVFIDHLMPGMDGLDTLSAIRKVRKDIPAIALTANFGSGARALYLEAGFTDYLAKPIDKEYALRAIYKLLPEETIESSGKPNENEESSQTVFAETKRVPVVITTDSVSDIPDHLLKKYNIPIIPFYINTSEGRRYKDREEISSDSLIGFINNDDRYAFSEAPKETEYELFFGDVLSKADSIIHLSVAKNNSEGYKNASIAARSFANVEVIDSGNVCFGLGIIAVYAARLAMDGADAAEIKKKVLLYKDKVKFDFVIDETRNLAATGRISLFVHRFCSFFNVHPVIKLRDSRMVVRTVRFGDINKIRDRYYKKVCKSRDMSDEFLALLHSNFDNETLQRIEEELKSSVSVQEYMVLSPGAAIASNCGRGAFGICYKRK